MRFRTPTLLLCVSLAANAGLVALVLVKAPYVFQPSTYAPAKPAAQATAAQSLPSRPADLPTAAQLADLDKGDLKALAAHLRAQGFSRSLIRSLLFDRVNQLFYDRKKQLAALLVAQPYWSKSYGRLDPKAQSAMTALFKEQGDMVNAAMGPDDAPDDDPISEVMMNNQRGGLPAQDYKRIQSIENDYNQMKYELSSKINGPWLPDDMARMAYLEKEEKEDMKNAVSPDEYLAYEMHNSPGANNLRNQLQAFNPTQDEFDAIYKAQAEFDDKYGAQFSPMSQEQQDARRAHLDDLQASIASALGPDRFADYKVETDQNYISTSNLVDRLGLPSSVTPQLASLQNDISKRADAIRNDGTLSGSEKQSQLASLGDEGAVKVAALVGNDNLAAYTQAAGWWITGLRAPKK